ncbi:hypothetical protein [Corticicoccus populi]|uniref:Uncharacterized protein n=1 Tax=Corticicoccus populi TaxID=1812821 RepID=A0ABW5WYV0_9STAP
MKKKTLFIDATLSETQFGFDNYTENSIASESRNCLKYETSNTLEEVHHFINHSHDYVLHHLTIESYNELAFEIDGYTYGNEYFNIIFYFDSITQFFISPEISIEDYIYSSCIWRSILSDIPKEILDRSIFIFDQSIYLASHINKFIELVNRYEKSPFNYEKSIKDPQGFFVKNFLDYYKRINKEEALKKKMVVIPRELLNKDSKNIIYRNMGNEPTDVLEVPSSSSTNENGEFTISIDLSWKREKYLSNIYHGYQLESTVHMYSDCPFTEGFYTELDDLDFIQDELREMINDQPRLIDALHHIRFKTVDNLFLFNTDEISKNTQIVNAVLDYAKKYDVNILTFKEELQISEINLSEDI